MKQAWFMAHEGHPHEPTSTTPWWSDELTLISVVVVLFVSLMLVTTYVLKLKPATRLMLAMAYLLVVGIFSYRISAGLSVMALALGMALALTTTLLQLAKQNNPRK